MTKGPHRKILDDYLDSAMGHHLQAVGRDWRRKAEDLQTLSDALKLAAGQAELRIGEQTLTGPALRAGMEKSSTSMADKSGQLRAAGDALVTVGQQINDTKEVRDSMADLGPKPEPYSPPAPTPGVEPTKEELQAQADASQARANARGSWQTEFDKQEAKALALTKEMDAAFLGAIPPMKEIHGQDDPTEPPPNVPSGPGGTYLPGTQAPPPTGGGAHGAGDHPQVRPGDTGVVHIDDNDNDNTTNITPTHPITTTPTHPITTTPTHPTISAPTLPTAVPTETTTVTGSQQSGVTYQPTAAQVSAPTSAGGSAGVNAAAFGAAGAAGGMGGMSGAVRAGAAHAPAGSAPARPIGSTARSASAGALSRSASAPGSAAARSAGAAGSPASRAAASSAGARGAAAGSTAGRGAGSAGGRGAASGSSTGSRSGGRGSGGARAAGVGGAAGRGGRKGERDEAGSRDSLVYDQDWLGDDDIAPGVLD